MIEHCSKCGRERPDYFADPTCPGGGYCNWAAPSWKLLRAAMPSNAKLSHPDLVKLTFETSDGSAREFLWVRIRGPLHGPDADPQQYTGTIHSEPGNKALPPFGTIVEFEAEHVVDLSAVLLIRGGLGLLGRPKDDTDTT